MRRQSLAVVADGAVIVACLFIVYTAFGGEVRWQTPLFRITLTEPNRPIQICLLAVLLKAVSGRDRGLFAALAGRRVPIVSPLSARLHRLDQRLRTLFLAYRAPLLLSAAALVVSLGLLELYLRHFPHTLPHALGNHVATRYHAGPSGIYRHAPELGMDLMRPNDERTMYFNGYWWRHKTDSRGFRNPVERAAASVVLSGDSIVYGHGVDEPSTVRHHLETLLGQPVVNLGMQGSSIHHEYQVLRTFGLPLRPRYVFLFFLANDVDDLTALTDGEMSAFLDTPLEDHSTPYVDVGVPRARGLGIEPYLADLYVAKALDFVRQYVRERWRRPAEAADDAWASRPPFRGNPRLTRAMRVHFHALRKIQHLAHRHGFAFVNVFTYTGQIPDESAYETLLESFCRAHGIAFLSLRPAFEQALRSSETVFLKGDGHFSDGGARLAARVLAQYIEAHPAS